MNNNNFVCKRRCLFQSNEPPDFRWFTTRTPTGGSRGAEPPASIHHHLPPTGVWGRSPQQINGGLGAKPPGKNRHYVYYRVWVIREYQQITKKVGPLHFNGDFHMSFGKKMGTDDNVWTWTVFGLNLDTPEV